MLKFAAHIAKHPVAREVERIADLIQERDRTRAFTAEQALILATIIELEATRLHLAVLHDADREVEVKLQALDRQRERHRYQARWGRRSERALLFAIGCAIGFALGGFW